MATIDSRKLLPSSTKGSAIDKPKFLVPIKNISTKKISGSDLKPIDKKTETSGSLVVLKKKIIKLDSLIQNNLLIDQKERTRKRKEEERSKVEKREADLEKGVKKNNVRINLISSIPGQSILDKINRFIGFTLLGYLFNKYGELLPKLMEFGKVLKPVAEFVESFAKNLLKGVIDFVEFGYKAYDKTRDFVKQIGGEGAQKTFDEFSKQLNLLLNGAIAASMLIASSKPKPTSTGSGSFGAGYASGYAAGLSASRGGRPGAGFRDPSRYRSPGQARSGGFDLEQTRRINTQANSAAPTGPKGPLDRISRGIRGAGAQLETGTLFKRGAGLQKSLYNAPGKIKSISSKLGGFGGKIFGRIPIIGGLINFAISLALGEDPGRAAAKAVGSTAGAALGTFIPVPGVGTILGGILGDIAGGALYDTLIGNKQKPQGRAEGGQVTRGGQSTVAPSRRIKKPVRKAPPRIQPQKTQPGKDVGGKLKIEELYGKDEPGKRSALRALRKSSDDVKRMKSINGLAGSMFGAGIDMALGQKPDKNLSKNLGNIFGSVIASAVDMELNNSLGDISKTIAMANGGVVPSREIGKSLSIGERIGSFISRALAVSIESSASKILQNLRNEMNLEGGAPGTTPSDGGPGGGGGEIPGDAPPEVKAMLEAISAGEGSWDSVNPSTTVPGLSNMTIADARKAAIAKGVDQLGGSGAMGKWQQMPAFILERARDVGLDPNKDKFNPENQTKIARMLMASVYPGGESQLVKDAQRDPMSAAAKLRGTWPSLPGGSQANTKEKKFRENFAKALQSYKSPSAVLTKGSFASVLPRGNPQFTSGFGSRWGRNHQGIDIGVDANSPVTALQDGKVVAIYKNFGGHGVGIVVQHSDGTKIVYGHVNANVREGDTVKKGQTIATVKGWFNAYGNKDNTHLHLERYVGGAATDPTGYLNSLSKSQPDTRPASSPPSQVRTKLTRSNQWDPSKSGLKFNEKTGMYEKASLAPSQSSSVASLNKSGILKEDTSTMIYNNNAVAILPIEVTA
jgi:hypothetical protein